MSILTLPTNTDPSGRVCVPVKISPSNSPTNVPFSSTSVPEPPAISISKLSFNLIDTSTSEPFRSVYFPSPPAGLKSPANVPPSTSPKVIFPSPPGAPFFTTPV